MPAIDTLDTEIKEFEPGEIIFKEGDHADVMYSVLAGKVQIRAHDKIVYFAGPGEVIGEMALIDNQPRSATATAKAKCKLAVIDEKRFKFLLQKTPLIITQILKSFSDRLRLMNQDS